MKIKELADNKLIILFFIYTLDIPLTNEQVTDFFIKKYFMNYFDLQQFLAELVETQHLIYSECRTRHYYSISDKGKEVLDFFRSRIDLNAQALIRNYSDENRERIKRESQLTADYKRLDNNEYEVLLRVMERDIILLELKLNVTSSEQAKTLCSGWKSKAPEVYKKIMESLI